MARTAKSAAEILVHYIRLAITDTDVRGDMNAELQSVIDDFDAIDKELVELRKRTSELDNRTMGQKRYGGVLAP